MATTSRLGFSEFNSNKSEYKNKRKNKTIKKQSKPSQKVKQFLNSMNIKQWNNDDDEDDDNLADFKSMEPLPPPDITNFPDDKQEDQNFNLNNPEQIQQLQVPASYNHLENPENLKESYKNYINYYTKLASSGTLKHTDDKLMEKLNYMIHLLEENKDVKTDNVTEELILYMFLGIFIIFIVDGFARAGKYTR